MGIPIFSAMLCVGTANHSKEGMGVETGTGWNGNGSERGNETGTGMRAGMGAEVGENQNKL